VRTTFLAVAAGLLTAALAAGAPALTDKLAKNTPAVVKKLHGDWMGERDCQGDLSVHAEGTFERLHYGPGNATLAGTWTIRWDAQAPTLVLTCKTSTDPDYVGMRWDMRIVELDDQTLGYMRPGSSDLTRYARSKK
jgi:hypothetical protein